jgi:hypothetical protein
VYGRLVDREGLRAFAERDWEAVEASKGAYHARRHRENRDAAFALGQALWQHARRMRPERPDVRERDADLAHHVKVKQALERADHAVARR